MMTKDVVTLKEWGAFIDVKRHYKCVMVAVVGVLPHIICVLFYNAPQGILCIFCHGISFVKNDYLKPAPKHAIKVTWIETHVSRFNHPEIHGCCFTRLNHRI